MIHFPRHPKNGNTLPNRHEEIVMICHQRGPVPMGNNTHVLACRDCSRIMIALTPDGTPYNVPV